MHQRRTTIIAVCLISLALVGTAQADLIFDLTPDAGTSAQAQAGFQEAADLWSALLSDAVTININIGFTALPAGILGSTSVVDTTFTYAATKAALAGDAKSGDDATAVANLQGGSALEFYINRTANHPDGAGDVDPYLDDDGDANNTTMWMSTANAKALGLMAANAAASDASITFSSAYSWDFDASDGITAGAYDFVGVAAHEIGHALGFISGVDVLDVNSPPYNGPFDDDQFTFFSPLDLYRYSSLGLDWTADDRDKWFSIDGGTTSLGAFSEGVYFGDGRQASHWKDHLGLGLMDPTASKGAVLSISALDVQAFDVIGWDVGEPIPEPGTITLFAAGLVGFGLVLRRRRRRNQ